MRRRFGPLRAGEGDRVAGRIASSRVLANARDSGRAVANWPTTLVPLTIDQFVDRSPAGGRS